MRHSQKYEQRILVYLEKVNNADQSQEFNALQKWQANRLLTTHYSLYEQQRFKPAMDFFVDELYSAEHFHRRNRELIRATPIMCNTMPQSVLAIVDNAAELHSLSLELDALLLHHLPSGINIANMTLTEWTLAYRLSNNSVDRQRQIDLIEILGHKLAETVKKPQIRTLLKLARLPAKMAGYHDIHQFVSRGFDAFEQLHHADDFLIPVIRKERELSEQWFQG